MISFHHSLLTTLIAIFIAYTFLLLRNWSLNTSYIFLKKKKIKLHMLFIWILFETTLITYSVKEHWHHNTMLRTLNTIGKIISFMRECKTVLQLLVNCFFLVWWRQTSLWCYCETAGVAMAKTEMFVLTSNLWWNLQYQNGKEVNFLSSYRYIKHLHYFCIQTLLNKLFFICPPLSLSLRKKEVFRKCVYFLEYWSLLTWNKMGRVYWSSYPYLW